MGLGRVLVLGLRFRASGPSRGSVQNGKCLVSVLQRL